MIDTTFLANKESLERQFMGDLKNLALKHHKDFLAELKDSVESIRIALDSLDK